MARVFIPPPLRELTDGRQVVEASARTVAEAVDQLERQFPGVRARLLDDGGRLRSGTSVTVNDAVAARGLRQELQDDAEVHFLPALGGG